MGIVSSLLSQSNNNMKFLLVLAVAAYVKADADPGFAYSVGHLPLAYAHAAPLVYTAAHAPVVYTAPAAGCQNSEGKFVPCAQGSYFGYVPVAAEAAPAVEAERKKREAEAEPTAEAEADPEADPWLYYSGLYGHHGYGYGGYHYAPLTYSYAPYTYSHVYNHYGLGGYAYYGRKKREAVAEPEANAEADPWLLYGGYAGGYAGYGGYAYAPYTYAAYHHPLTYFYGGCRNNQGALVPCA